jgi:hypothetical protein
MMKRVSIVSFVLLSTIFLQACEEGMPLSNKTEEIHTRCMDGIVYYLFKERGGTSGYGYMAPKYSRDGYLVRCEEEKDEQSQ